MDYESCCRTKYNKTVFAFYIIPFSDSNLEIRLIISKHVLICLYWICKEFILSWISMWPCKFFMWTWNAREWYMQDLRPQVVRFNKTRFKHISVVLVYKLFILTEVEFCLHTSPQHIKPLAARTLTRLGLWIFSLSPIWDDKKIDYLKRIYASVGRQLFYDTHLCDTRPWWQRYSGDLRHI